MALRHLNGEDAAFLYCETPTAPMHVASITIVDPSDAGGAFSFDLPFWVEDDTFDPREHIGRVSLPQPGSERELYDLQPASSPRPAGGDSRAPARASPAARRSV